MDNTFNAQGRMTLIQNEILETEAETVLPFDEDAEDCVEFIF